MPDSPFPGVPQTGAKSNVAAISTGAAALISPLIVSFASQYFDPTWAANCLNASGLTAISGGAAVVVAGVAALAGKLWTHATVNKPITTP